MLDLLIKYAQDQGLVTEPGFKPKRARWALLFDTDGQFQGVQELGDVGSKKNSGRQFGCCPELSQPEMKAAGDGCRHFLLDSIQVVSSFGIDKLEGKDVEKAQAKRDYFVNLLRQAADVMPELHSIAESLSNEATRARVNAELAKGKAKPTENATFAITSPLRFLVDTHRWHDWWRQFRQSLSNADGGSSSNQAGKETRAFSMLCLATGELVTPTATHPKIEGLSDVGGLAMGDALVSFKQDSFRSFGLEQSSNAAMSEQTASTYRAALNHLLREHCQKIAGVKIVHWFAGEKPVPSEDDPFGMLNDPGIGDPSDSTTEVVAQSRAGKLLQSIRAGERVDLLQYRFYALALSGNSGRVVIRDWMEGQFRELVENIDTWFNDLAITRRDGGGLAPPPKFFAVLASTVRDLSDVPAPTIAKLWRVALRSEPIPGSVIVQALARAKIEVIDPDSVPNQARYGLMKAYLVRKGDSDMASFLNEDHPEPAYQCGRVMAVLADIQLAALPDVKAGIVQRYYAAASSTPALVLGRLFRTANFHLDKIRGDRPWLARRFEDRLASITTHLNPDLLPHTLGLEQQTLFALGYYQQKAARNSADKSDGENASEST